MKKALCYILTVMLLLASVVVPTENFKAYEANITLGVSASSIKIGDSVTVSVSVPSNASGPVALYFPKDLLEFSSASATVNQNGGTVLISIGPDGLAKTNKVTVTFKAKTSGTATVSAESAGDVYDDAYEEVTLIGASTSITIANETTEDDKSPDNSLSSIKLSSGTLSPSFQYNVTKYTATVGYNVSSITVTAKASHEKATIESITGNGTIALEVGENTIQIVVKAENGQKATYTIVVTRKAESESEDETESETESETETDDPVSLEDILTWNGEQYEVPETIPADMMPEDFAQNTILINSVDVPCFSFTKGNLTVLCLKNSNGANVLFVYDDIAQCIYPFVKIQSENNYVVILLPDEVNAPAPANAQACTLSIEGKGIIYAYQFVEQAMAEFYLVYCVNSNGTLGWYLYDSIEGTAQRYVADVPVAEPETEIGATINTTDLQTQYDLLAAKLTTAKTIQMIAIVVAVVLAVLFVIVLILYLKKRSDEEWDDLEETVIEEPIKKVEPIDEPVDEDDEIEIEFYEMEPEEEEVEVEFYEMKTEDEVKVEFFEMTEKDLTEKPVVQEPPVAKPVESVETHKEDDEDDDDIEFIEL